MTEAHPIPPGLVGYDWACAFQYAGEKPELDENGFSVDEDGAWGLYGVANVIPVLHSKVSTAPFTRRDVISQSIRAVPGRHDEKTWICVGELRDGRFFALVAGCDYTGWD